MMELWWRNPRPYVDYLKEVHHEINVLWDVSYLFHHRIDAFSFMAMNFGICGPWRFIKVDPMGRFAEMYSSSNRLLGTFPVWHAQEDSIENLLDFIENPEENQEHRILIWNLDARGRRDQVVEIANLQRANPEVIFHAFNYYSYNVIFGQGFKASDYDPMGTMPSMSVKLPSGKEFSVKKLEFLDEDSDFWIKCLGFKVAQLTERQNRIKFNVVSASWAAVHFNELPNIKPMKYIPIASAVGKEVLTKKTPMVKTRLPIQASDKKACDFCSLWSNCRYYREGSVCTVPGSDYEEIAKNLGNRDSFQIAQGISSLLAVNVQRIEEARQAEKSASVIKQQYMEDISRENPGAAVQLMAKGKSGVIDPELTKLIDSTVKSGLALANLYKISEASGNGKVIIQVNGGASTSIEGEGVTASPAVTKEIAARAVAEIEASGVPREEISEEHFNSWLRENMFEGEII